MKTQCMSVACLALALCLPSFAQTQSAENSSLVEGTGVTVAELRDLGWNTDQIASLQNSPDNPQGSAQSAQTAQSSPGAQTNPQGNDANQAASPRTGSGWGLWGLLGLLGLLGLGGRKRTSVRDERDIRRVA